MITSNTSFLSEVAGDAALLVNPLEVFEIYEAMEALAKRPEVRGAFRTKGLERSKKFSWEKTARQTFETYKKVFAAGEIGVR